MLVRRMQQQCFRRELAMLATCAVVVATVPASAGVVVRGGDGSVSVADLTGAVSVRTGNGSISLDGVAGDVVAHTGNGRVSGAGRAARPR